MLFQQPANKNMRPQLPFSTKHLLACFIFKQAQKELCIFQQIMTWTQSTLKQIPAVADWSAEGHSLNFGDSNGYHVHTDINACQTIYVSLRISTIQHVRRLVQTKRLCKVSNAEVRWSSVRDHLFFYGDKKGRFHLFFCFFVFSLSLSIGMKCCIQ